jgi:hypothetical protein
MILHLKKNKNVEKLNFFVTSFLIFLYFFAPLGPANSSLLISWPVNSYTKLLLLTFLIFTLLYLYRSGKRISKRNSVILYIVIIFMIFFKIMVLQHGNDQIRGCYKLISNINIPYSQTYSCERSWDNLFDNSFTRNDESINFGIASDGEAINKHINDGNWNLSALNSNVYSYYLENQPNPYKLDINAIWKTNIKNEKYITVSYLGEGTVTLNEDRISLPESYSNVSEKIIYIPDQISQLKIDFKWKQVKDSGSWAYIQVKDSEGNYLKSPIEKIVHFLIITINFFSFAIVLLLFIVFGLTLFQNCQKTKNRIFFNQSFLIFILLLYCIFNIIFLNSLNYLAISYILLFLILFTLNIFGGSGLFFNLTNVFIMAISLILNSKFGLGTKMTIFYRGRGEDFLTYESFARDILITGSLQGGEDVFVYSPFFRYLLLFLHTIIGDADNLLFPIYLFTFLVSINFLFKNLVRRVGYDKLESSFSHILLYSLIILFSIFISSFPLFFGGYQLLSESPTWIFLILVFAILIKNEKSYFDYISLGALLGCMLILRANQLIGIILIVIFIIHEARISSRIYKIESIFRKQISSLLFAFFFFGSLTFFHNLFYGKQIQFLQTSLPLPVNFPLKVSDIFLIGSDSSIRLIFMEQIKGLLAISPDLLTIESFSTFTFAVRAIQLFYIIFLLLFLFKVVTFSIKNILLFIAPLGFLVPHLFLQIYVYHPRHIVIGYLSIFLILIYFLATSSIRDPKKILELI